MDDLAWRSTEASPTHKILADEFTQIHGRAADHYEAALARPSIQSGDDLASAKEPAVLDAILKDHLEAGAAALCLSGGGIRSAAFCLGVIQWLTKNKLLQQFQYLSTVSGGGYIGAWLSTWIAKEKQHWRDVAKRIVWDGTFHAEAAEIRHLRENSSYLTPRKGLTSGDTWAGIGLTLRNLILNWLLIVPLVAVLALLPKVMLTAVWPGPARMDPVSFASLTRTHVYPFFILAWSAYATSVFVIAFRRPRWTRKKLSRMRAGWFIQVPLVVGAISWSIAVALSAESNWYILAPIYVGVLLPLYAGAWIWAILMWRFGPGKPLVHVSPARRQKSHGHLRYVVTLSRSSQETVSVEVHTEDRQACRDIHFKPLDPGDRTLAFKPGQRRKSVTVDLIQGKQAEIDGRPATANTIRLGLGQFVNAYPMGPAWRREAVRDVIFALVRACTVGLLLSAAHLFLASNDRGSAWPVLVTLMLGVPAAIGAHLAGAILFTGLNSTAPKSESDREWHGRIDGVALALALAWIAWWTADLIVPLVLSRLFDWGVPQVKEAFALVSTIGAVAGGIAAWLGQSAKTAATADEAAEGWKATLALPIIGVIALVFLFAATSLGLDPVFGLKRLYLLNKCYRPEEISIGAWRGFGLLLVMLIVPTALGFFININRFSLHSIYRNRLIRAFLGASLDRGSAPRTPSRDRSHKPGYDPLTAFDDDDNIELQRLWKRRTGGGPLQSEDWRPFHIINIALNVVSSRDLSLKDRKALPFVATPLWCGSSKLRGDIGAFRRSSEFGGEQKTITVGTAMAISGAAVSPNMGYNSSPLISLILTLFNVRLGWWYGNPADDETYRREGPRWAIKPLIYEAFGLTNETRPYVYLSDGGHFDNLGLYEIVRRRCRHVVVVDAGQDGKCTFEDLSNSVARIRTDFGIPIIFDLSTIRARNNNRLLPNDGGDGFAIGRIVYSEIDGADAEDGTILYVKPPLRGDEPPSVLGYANKSPTFPHETTGNQSFTELQFESYRALGYETMRRLAASISCDPSESETSLAEVFDKLRPWPRPQKPQSAFDYIASRQRRQRLKSPSGS